MKREGRLDHTVQVCPFQMQKGVFFRAILNGYLSVDSFFIMGGCLLSYLTLKEMDRTNGWLNVPMFYIHRYVR